MEQTAEKIKALNGFTGEAWLYRLNPPLGFDYRPEDHDGPYEYVAVSAAVVGFGVGPETYIFGADGDGNVLNWLELPGSFRGGLDHDQAIRNAGYTIAPQED